MPEEQKWFESPFGHIVYTLCTTKKQIKKAGFEVTDSDACGNTTFYTNEKGTAAIVLICKNKHSLIDNHALVAHEAVHIWQEIKLLMGEKEPSSEFEAYSIQEITRDLLSLMELK